MASISSSSASIVILAAGLGKRMHSSLPKVLIPVCGRPMVFQILDQIATVSPRARVALVVGHQKELVIEKVLAEKYPMELSFVEQPEQKGTGHAVKCAMESAFGKSTVSAKGSVLVLPGDLPLITADLLHEMLEPLRRGSVMRLLTATLSDPTGYGRIVRKGKKGAVLRIVEEKDATPREKLIQEVGVSIYSFQAGFLANGTASLKNNNAQKEYYLTDLVGMAVSKRRTIETLNWDSPEDVRGVNNPYELSLAADLLNSRVIRSHALAGVRFVDLTSCRIDPSVQLEKDVTLYPGVVLEGRTFVGEGTVLGPHVHLKDMVIGAGCEVKTGTVGEDSIVGAGVKLGPYAHLRPGSVVKDHAKIGNFVELKKSTIGEGTSVAHLSYVGDADIGARVNIGCGFVTCNYDGRVIQGSRKHKTVIEDDVFVGSDCQTVAPVTLKKGSFIASGSTITENVEEGALAIARSRQVVKPGYAKKLKAGES
jgi:bifunctional UDP-N-acetylglucosamine pyrophosphorylase/glucosamine-1-phosphate N-acetyltransferase